MYKFKSWCLWCGGDCLVVLVLESHAVSRIQWHRLGPTLPYRERKVSPRTVKRFLKFKLNRDGRL